MDYKELKQTINSYSSKKLEERRIWYSIAAEAYNQVRPRYHKDVITQVINIAQLSSNSQILEVGCGPATATVAFAQLGFSMLCLEPNPNFYQLAQQNCQQYPKVAIENTSFEEWTLENEKFDAVLAASSFHWIPADIGYPKAAKALKEKGYLILLWNKELQPNYEVYQSLSEIYQVHAPSLNRYEDRKTQEKILQGFGQIVTESDQFKDLVAGYVECQVTYTVDEYLMLLTTYSQYLKLAPQIEQALFAGLSDKIECDFGGQLELSYISAFHVAQKLPLEN